MAPEVVPKVMCAGKKKQSYPAPISTGSITQRVNGVEHGQITKPIYVHGPHVLTPDWFIRHGVAPDQASRHRLSYFLQT